MERYSKEINAAGFCMVFSALLQLFTQSNHTGRIVISFGQAHTNGMDFLFDIRIPLSILWRYTNLWTECFGFILCLIAAFVYSIKLYKVYYCKGREFDWNSSHSESMQFLFWSNPVLNESCCLWSNRLKIAVNCWLIICIWISFECAWMASPFMMSITAKPVWCFCGNFFSWLLCL